MDPITPKGLRWGWGGTHKPSESWKETYLAGSWQEVQLYIGVSQAVEIHGLEALEDRMQGGL